MSVKRLLNQDAIIYPKSSTGPYNIYGRDISDTSALVALKCRFENKTKTKLLPDGQVINLLGNVYLPGDTSINTEDRILIDNVSYKVFSVNGSIDGRGIQKVVRCEVQKWQT